MTRNKILPGPETHLRMPPPALGLTVQEVSLRVVKEFEQQTFIIEKTAYWMRQTQEKFGLKEVNNFEYSLESGCRSGLSMCSSKFHSSLCKCKISF